MIEFFDLKLPFKQDELKKNYRRLLLQYHPDKIESTNKTEKELAENKTKSIIFEYKILKKWLEKERV